MKIIFLDILEEGLPAVSPSFGKTLVEAGVVCLESEKHEKGVSMKIAGEFEKWIALNWTLKTTPQIRNTWNDTEEATEYGAVAIALSIVALIFDMEVVLKSRRGSGLDYWLGQTVEGGPPIIKSGLEISGIRHETRNNSVSDRVRIKRKQVANQTVKDVYIIIVEFGQPLSYIAKK